MPTDTDHRKEPAPVDGSRIGGAIIALFLAAQLLLPLGPFFISPAVNRADFSWDMFSYRRRCPPKLCPGFFARSASGKAQRLGWGKGFRSRVQIARIRYQSRLPRYARFLCERYEKRWNEPVEVYGECACYYGRPGPDKEPVPIIEPGRNYCEDTP